MQRRMRKMESLGYPPLVVSSSTIKQINEQLGFLLL